MLTIDHEGVYYLAFNFFVTLCCLLSSFMYLMFAAFRISHIENLDYHDKLVEGEMTYYQISVLILCFECIFGIQMITKFMLSYTRDTDLKKISDLKLTWRNYLATDFIYDFLPILPF
jgi:hypothetical protein